MLLAQQANQIQFANANLQPIAFALKHATWKTYFFGVIGEIAAWLTLIFSFIFLLLLAILSIALTQSAALTPRILRIQTLKRIVHYWTRGRWVAQRQRYNSYKKLLTDKRAPVLYLRSFSAHYDYEMPKDGKRSDERLSEVFESMGPVIAIAEPDAKGFMPGPVRLYFEEAVWRAGVIYLMSISQIVIIQAGMSHGTLWELGTAKQKLKPEKVVIYFADGYLDDGSGPISGAHTYYHDFKDYAERVMECDLPKGRHPLIGFDSNWEPLLLGDWGAWRAKIIEREGRHQSWDEIKAMRASLSQLYESYLEASKMSQDPFYSRNYLKWLKEAGKMVSERTGVQTRHAMTVANIHRSIQHSRRLDQIIRELLNFELLSYWEVTFLAKDVIEFQSSRVNISKDILSALERDLGLINELVMLLEKDLESDNPS